MKRHYSNYIPHFHILDLQKKTNHCLTNIILRTVMLLLPEPKDKDYKRVIRKMYSKSSVCHHRTQVLESQKNSGSY